MIGINTMGTTKKESQRTQRVVAVKKGLTEAESLSVCAEVLHGLLLDGINTLILTTDDDEEIKVHMVNMGKKQELVKDIEYLADLPPIDQDVSINEQ